MALRSLPSVVRVALLLSFAWLAGSEAVAILPGHPGAATVFGNWPAETVQVMAGLLCVAVARRHTGQTRLAWTLIAGGIFAWTAGDIYLVGVYGATEAPIPSPADAGYLLFPPLVLAGVVALLRARIPHVPRTLMVDVTIVALAAATVSAAFVIGPVAKHAAGGTLEVATNLAYPISDLMLLVVVLSAVALRGWRLDRTWTLLGLGTVAFLAADVIYAITSAYGTYSQPNLFDAGWPLAMVLFASAAWAPPEPPLARRARTLQDIVAPLGIAFPVIAVTMWEPPDTEHMAAIVLAVLCVAAVMVRLVMTFRETMALAEASHREALTDALTGLRNRRALMADLDEEMAGADDGRPLVVALFDLDGFKSYNDSFGHPAGDALLSRLGHDLARVVIGRGQAYRLGGDEFCVVLRPGHEIAQPVLDAALQALAERGDGFNVGCSMGVVTVPREADQPMDALRIADQRLYAAKSDGRVWDGHQATDLLWRALYERDAELASHVEDVASLAEGVARRLGLGRVEVEQVGSAAKLHDVGKVAIPDAILHKPGPLDEHEWRFIREHTVIGERIISASPALSGVAPLVRSSHERFDGAGYPDGLAGLDIPLGARIVAVCDAFDAMITDRSYRPARSPAWALVELRRCAGAQFDPAVVEAFAEEWAAHEACPRWHAVGSSSPRPDAVSQGAPVSDR